MIEESGANVVYRPGKQNIVADALSRQYVNAIDLNEDHSDLNSMHSRASSPIVNLPRTMEPLNTFKVQIELEHSNINEVQHTTIFPTYIRYTIKYNSIFSAIQQMKHALNEKNINALYLNSDEDLDLIENIKKKFSNCKILISKTKVRDITDEDEQKYIMMTEHNRAHRGSKENYMQLKTKYFWPKLKQNIQSYIQTCEICKKNKYERHPMQQEIGETPIPQKVAEMIHMDIFFIDNHKFLTCIDKYSKFLQIFHLRSNTEIPKLIEQILVIYPNVVNVTTDNDPSFTSHIVKNIFDIYNIKHYTTAINHSTTNGQVERVHSTILELARALAEQQHQTISEIIFQVVRQYNNTIHSVIQQKPSEVLYFSNKFPQISELLKQAQIQTLKNRNKNRVDKKFKPGDTIFVKSDRRNKNTPRYTKHIVQTDKHVTVTTTKGKEIHKDNIRK